ncbi:hypothetical protein ACWGKS_21915 [Nocardiopsis sp. NPDC055879]
MISLPYTELRVPTTTLRVTDTTFLADGRILSTIQEGETVLGKLTVGPHAVDLDMNVDARRFLSAFTGLCWTVDGKRPSRETVLRELVMEYRYDRAITEATEADRPTVAVRAFHTNGTITLHQVDAPGPIGPGPELKVDPALFTTDVVRVQAWMRDLWLGVSPLLPGQEHQPPTRLTSLTHTGLRVPMKFRMRVSHLKKSGDGEWSAQVWVRVGSEPVYLGPVAGDGDNLTFEGDGPHGHRLLLTYALMSRGPEGEPVEWQEVVALLMRERQMAREAARARSQGYYLVCLTRTGEEGPTTDLVGIMDATPGATYPDYDGVRTCAAKFAGEPQMVRV